MVTLLICCHLYFWRNLFYKLSLYWHQPLLRWWTELFSGSGYCRNEWRSFLYIFFTLSKTVNESMSCQVTVFNKRLGFFSSTVLFSSSFGDVPSGLELFVSSELCNTNKLLVISVCPHVAAVYHLLFITPHWEIGLLLFVKPTIAS